jgi:hypothetical protein
MPTSPSPIPKYYTKSVSSTQAVKRSALPSIKPNLIPTPQFNVYVSQATYEKQRGQNMLQDIFQDYIKQP